MNQVWLNGRLSSEVEASTSSSGVSYCTFSLAVEKQAKGERTAMFFDCVAFRETATFVADHFAKGDAINVVGSLSVRDWTDRNGVKHRKYEILVNSVGFPVGGKRTKPAGKSNGDDPAQPVGAAADNPGDYYH